MYAFTHHAATSVADAVKSVGEGKYLAGGMTFGAFGGRADVMDAFDPVAGGTLTHGGTYNNNVVTMAAGAAAMSELLSAEVLDALYARGDDLQRRIADVFSFNVERTAAGGAVEGTFNASGSVPRIADEVSSRGFSLESSLFTRPPSH